MNSIKLSYQSIYKVSMSETTNDIAFISKQNINNQANRIFFYTCNCDLINQIDNCDDNSSENILMKSLCFSNCTEGQNVNVIAVGLSNGRIRLYSTWDLTLLREITINQYIQKIVNVCMHQIRMQEFIFLKQSLILLILNHNLVNHHQHLIFNLITICLLQLI